MQGGCLVVARSRYPFTVDARILRWRERRAWLPNRGGRPGRASVHRGRLIRRHRPRAAVLDVARGTTWGARTLAGAPLAPTSRMSPGAYIGVVAVGSSGRWSHRSSPDGKSWSIVPTGDTFKDGGACLSRSNLRWLRRGWQRAAVQLHGLRLTEGPGRSSLACLTSGRDVYGRSRACSGRCRNRRQQPGRPGDPLLPVAPVGTWGLAGNVKKGTASRIARLRGHLESLEDGSARPSSPPFVAGGRRDHPAAPRSARANVRDRKSRVFSKTPNAGSDIGLRQRDARRPVDPQRGTRIPSRALTPDEHPTEPQVSLVESTRPCEPPASEEGLILGVGPRPKGSGRRHHIERLGRASPDRDEHRVRRARRQLPKLGEQRRPEASRVGHAAQPRHLPD